MRAPRNKRCIKYADVESRRASTSPVLGQKGCDGKATLRNMVRHRGTGQSLDRSLTPHKQNSSLKREKGEEQNIHSDSHLAEISLARQNATAAEAQRHQTHTNIQRQMEQAI